MIDPLLIASSPWSIIVVFNNENLHLAVFDGILGGRNENRQVWFRV
jgi:hypothetical protein